MKIETSSFTDKEIERIDEIAQRREITREEAVEQLFSEGLAVRVRRHIGSAPAMNILNMRGRKQP